MPQPSIRAAGFAVAGPAGLLDVQRYHRLKIALSRVERDRRTEFCVGCRGVESDVNIMSGANVVQNRNEKSQPIDNQLRFYFRVPRTIFENCNFIPFVNTLIFSCLWVYCKDNQYIVIVDKIV